MCTHSDAATAVMVMVITIRTTTKTTTGIIQCRFGLVAVHYVQGAFLYHCGARNVRMPAPPPSRLAERAPVPDGGEKDRFPRVRRTRARRPRAPARARIHRIHALSLRRPAPAVRLSSPTSHPQNYPAPPKLLTLSTTIIRTFSDYCPTRCAYTYRILLLFYFLPRCVGVLVWKFKAKKKKKTNS